MDNLERRRLQKQAEEEYRKAVAPFYKIYRATCDAAWEKYWNTTASTRKKLAGKSVRFVFDECRKVGAAERAEYKRIERRAREVKGESSQPAYVELERRRAEIDGL